MNHETNLFQSLTHELRTRTARAECDAHLAMVSIHESAAAEYVGYEGYGSRYGRGARGPGYDDDPSNWEIYEIYEHTQTIHEWRTPNGAHSDWGTMPFEVEELSPPGVLDGEPPDEEHFHEATGNEGATAERTYRRAAIVVWPRSHRMVVLASGDTMTAVTYLEDLVGQPEPEDEACALAREIVFRWLEFGRGGNADAGGRFLDALTAHADSATIKLFVEEVIAKRGVGDSEAAALARSTALLDDSTVRTLAQGLAEQAGRNIGPPSDFLLTLARVADNDAQHLALAVISERIVAALPETFGFRVGGQRSVESLTKLCTALVILEDKPLVSRLTDHVLQHYDLDRLVLPTLTGCVEELGSPVVQAHLEPLWRAAVERLEARRALPLPAPDDWSQDQSVTCRCEHCAKVREFLSSPSERTLEIKVAKPVRQHLDRETSGGNLVTSTRRDGSPFTWVCRKIATRYTRRVEERKRDADTLARLRGEA